MKSTLAIWLSLMLVLSALLVIPADTNYGMGIYGKPLSISKPEAPDPYLRAPPIFNHWKLDETAGNTAYDSVGGDHGTINGATINQTGQIGACYLFDGSDDYVEISTNASINYPAGKDFSIFAWINTTDGNGRFLSKREFPGDAKGYMMHIQNNKFGAYLDFGSTGVYIEGAANVADGDWHHVGMVRTGDILEAFVDGSSIGTKPGAGGDLTNNNPLLFGVEQGLSMHFNGYIDDITFGTLDFTPNANAGPDQNVLPYTTVFFDGSASSDDYGITNYWWNFTDGTPKTLTGVSPTYTFDNESVYLVRLEVMDTVGQKDTDSMLVTVADLPPVANAGPDQQILPDIPMLFDGSASTDDVGITNYWWNFTDGVFKTLTGVSPVYTFDNESVFVVALEVMDTKGQKDADTMIVDVNDLDPVANAGPDQIVLPATMVFFDGSASSDDVGITNYWWNFTDGTPKTLTGVSPSYTFNNESLTLVILEVMDTRGQKDTDTMNVNITDQNPVANAGPDQVVYPNFPVFFDGSASSDDVGITNYWWNFTDGIPKTLTGVNPTYTFINESVVVVTLEVMDTRGQKDTDTMMVDVNDLDPVANAGPDQNVWPYTIVIFDGSASTDDAGITNFWWNFTDGTPKTLTGVSPIYRFDLEGLYTVTLTVMDTNGQTDSDTMVVDVSFQGMSLCRHWKLDETGGSIAYDSVGGDDGIVTGVTMNQTGKIGTCYMFDGDNDYVEISDNSSIDFQAGRDFGLFAWINTTSDYGRFISKRYYPGDASGYMMMVTDGKLAVYLDFGSTGAYIQGLNTIADGQWHLVGFVRTGSTLEAFVDGMSIGTRGNAGGDVSNDNPLLFGVEQGLTEDFTGYIDDITLFFKDYPPVAVAGPHQTVPQHTDVVFDGSGSTDDVGITNYWWNFTDFNGSQSLTGVSPNYTFNYEGMYFVVLTVMDRLGQTDSINMFVTVTDGTPPVAVAGPDQSGIIGEIISFDGSASYDPGHLGEPIINGIVNWTWTFNDGSGPVILYGPSPIHQFNQQGSFLVTLTVTDAAVPPGPWTGNDTLWVNISENFNIDIVPAILSDNWILISYPNDIEGDPLVVITDAVDEGAGLVTWDLVQWFDPLSPPGSQWKSAATFKPPQMNTFTYVNNTMSFWIHITNYGDGNLTMAGPSQASTSIPLYTGWNLVGYPSFTSKSIMSALAGTGYDAVEGYDWMAPYRLSPLADTYMMKPGEGYWIHMSFDTLWIVNW